ncbi:protein transport protein gos1 [Massospora cicadina]|nr:protein transport protein gos1 [Massospora cicadina]
MTTFEPQLKELPGDKFINLSRRARQLGLALESQLGDLSRLAFTVTPTGSGLVEAMEEILTERGSDLSPTFSHTLRRHRDQLMDFQREASKLEGVAHSARLSNRDRLTEPSEAAYFMNERTRIDSSHQLTDAALNQAYELRAELGQQGQTLASNRSRIAQLARTLPGLDGLLGRIHLRRRRDPVILGCVIALGILLLFFTLG